MKTRKKELSHKKNSVRAFIPITRHQFDDEDIKSVADTIKSGWLVQGRKVAEFEKMFCAFTGAKHSVATTSCTSALHLGLLAAGISKGDMVVVPSFTFIATANVVEYASARPIFCDIDIDTFNISVECLENLLKKYQDKIKAVIPVHLFGLCADMSGILRLSDKYGFKIIEDAACAFGSFYNGRHAGTIGMMGCFSFHPRKTITTGEGGIITVSDDKTASLLRSLRDHGASKSDLARHTSRASFLLPEYNILGYNYRMTDIQASLGISQMRRAKKILALRKKAAAIYNHLLKNVSWLKTPVVPSGCEHSYQSYVCLIDKKIFGGDIKKANLFRNNLMTELEKKGIATRQGTHAVHTLGYYKTKYKLKDEQLPNSLEADRLSITIPLYSQMIEDEQKYVAKQIKGTGEK